MGGNVTGFVLGRLLRFLVISEIQENLGSTSQSREPLVFRQTQYGKPYLVRFTVILSCRPALSQPLCCEFLVLWRSILQDAPALSPTLGFNVSHDKSAILLAVRRHDDTAMASGIGVDVMCVELPDGTPFEAFLESLGSAVRFLLCPSSHPRPLPLQASTSIHWERIVTFTQLTPRELVYLRRLASSANEATSAVYKLWTLKEAYVKALGVGITFDLSRIEYDFVENVMRVNGEPLGAWRIWSFEFRCPHTERGGDSDYVGAVCYPLRNAEGHGTGGCVLGGVDWVEIEAGVLIERMESVVSPHSG